MMHAKARTIFLSITIFLVVMIGYTVKITYSAFLTRSKVSQAFILIQPVKTVLVNYAIKNNGFTNNKELTNSSFDLPQPFDLQGTYISSIVTHKETSTSEVVILAYINTSMITNLEDERDRPLAAPYIKFNGTFSNKSITWRCDSNIAKHYLPQECQNN